MVHIIEGGTPRIRLREGRKQGLGAAMVKPLGNNNYKMLYGLSTCKDFLNDVIGAEHLNARMYVYGLRYIPQKIFKGSDYAYMAISILDNPGNPNETCLNFKKRESFKLKKGIAQMVEFLNYFEKLFNIGAPTECLLTDKEGIYLLKFDKQWASSVYMISIYSLLIRIGYRKPKNEKCEDFIKGILEEAGQWGFDGWSDDKNMFKRVYPKIQLFLDKGFPVENLEGRRDYYGLGQQFHNKGILELNIKYKETPIFFEWK